MPHLIDKHIGQAGMARNQVIRTHALIVKFGESTRPFFVIVGNPSIIIKMTDSAGQHIHRSLKTEFSHDLLTRRCRVQAVVAVMFPQGLVDGPGTLHIQIVRSVVLLRFPKFHRRFKGLPIEGRKVLPFFSCQCDTLPIYKIFS